MEIRFTRSVPAAELRPGDTFHDGETVFTASQITFTEGGGVNVAARRGRAIEGRRRLVQFKRGATVTIEPSTVELGKLGAAVSSALSGVADGWTVEVADEAVAAPPATIEPVEPAPAES